MQLEDLFEKREKSQLMLISTLMNQPIEAELKDVLTKTSLSRSTLLKYIDDLKIYIFCLSMEIKCSTLNKQLPKILKYPSSK